MVKNNMNFELTLIVISLFSGFKLSCGVAISDCHCAETRGRILNAKISGCQNDNATICVIQSGSELLIEVSFKSYENFHNAYVAATAADTFTHIVMDLPIPRENICTYIKCPVRGGHVVKLRKSMKIGKNIPSMPIPMDIEVKIKDSRDNAVIVCGKIKGAASG